MYAIHKIPESIYQLTVIIIICCVAGCFTDEFDISLGDCLDLSDSDYETHKNGKDGSGDKPNKKCKGPGLPPLDGSETVEAFVAKYKKTLLNKRTLLKEAKERLEKEECATHRTLVRKQA